MCGIFSGVVVILVNLLLVFLFTMLCVVRMEFCQMKTETFDCSMFLASQFDSDKRDNGNAAIYLLLGNFYQNITLKSVKINSCFRFGLFPCCWLHQIMESVYFIYHWKPHTQHTVCRCTRYTLYWFHLSELRTGQNAYLFDRAHRMKPQKKTPPNRNGPN